MSEFGLQVYVVGLLRLAATDGVIFFHPPNGEVRSARTGDKLRKMGVLPGVPDIVMTLPPDGKTAYLELKTEKGNLTAGQRIFRERAAASGALWAIARTPEQAFKTLHAWGAIEPERLNKS